MNLKIIAQAVLLLGIFLSTSSHGAQVPAKPNILFFLIDDLGFADCGFNGGKDIFTPNIDRLAKAGTVIDSHYVQPVCSPTRAALMTGRYATHTGVYTIVTPHAEWGLPLKERTLANALKDAGYSTAIVGKWHLGEFKPEHLPMARGFDHHYGHYFGALDYFTHKRGSDLDWYRDGVQLQEEGYTTHLLRDEACRIIEKQPADKPLFLYVPFNGIHSPHQVPEEYLKPYANLTGTRQKIAGMLSAVDEAIGRITDTLEKTGRGSNTLIVFSSDNGGPPPTDNTPLRGFKGSLWEGGVRAAAFAHWPGQIPAGARAPQPVHIIDWYPTLVKLAGGSLSQPTALDGIDIWPTLTQGKPSPHDAILSVSSPTAAALRVGDWKLMLSAGGNHKGDGMPAKGNRGVEKNPAPMLYNVAADPGETKDLSGSEPERVQAMRAKLDALLQNAAPPENAAAQK
jgi:arylsulfatase A-like enzyme